MEIRANNVRVLYDILSYYFFVFRACRSDSGLLVFGAGSGGVGYFQFYMYYFCVDAFLRRISGFVSGDNGVYSFR
jgi:hypothetical protein